MDMGVIKTFKCNYQRAVYREALKKMEEDSSMTLMNFWKQYNIRHALTIIKHAWDEVKTSTLNACWYALWPECVNNFSGFPAFSEQVRDIVNLAHTVGGEDFSDMTEEDVADLIDSHAAEPSVEELIQLQEDDKAGDDDDDADDDDTETRPVFTIKKLRHLLKEAENLTALFTDQDPILERTINFKRIVDEGLMPYKETLKEHGILCLPKAHHSILQTISSQHTSQLIKVIFLFLKYFFIVNKNSFCNKSGLLHFIHQKVVTFKKNPKIKVWERNLFFSY